MDMLYKAYSNPMDLVRLYINRGQFGKFVNSFLDVEYDRKKQAAERDEDMKLWMMFVQACMHSERNETFAEWKKRVLRQGGNDQKASRDTDLDDNGIKAIIADLFPAK